MRGRRKSSVDLYLNGVLDGAGKIAQSAERERSTFPIQNLSMCLCQFRYKDQGMSLGAIGPRIKQRLEVAYTSFAHIVSCRGKKKGEPKVLTRLWVILLP